MEVMGMRDAIIVLLSFGIHLFRVAKLKDWMYASWSVKCAHDSKNKSRLNVRIEVAL